MYHPELGRVVRVVIADIALAPVLAGSKVYFLLESVQAVDGGKCKQRAEWTGRKFSLLG